MPMAIKDEKYLTIQFHLKENHQERRLDAFLHTHPSKRKYHSQIATRVQDTDKVRSILQEFAQKRKYEYEYFQSKNEFHLRVPGYYLLQHSIIKEEAGSNHFSSNKELIQDELSLINFLGDVVYKMPCDIRPNTPDDLTGSSFLLKGFIRTTREKRSHKYTREILNNSEYEKLLSLIKTKATLYNKIENACIGIICLGNASKITINPSFSDNLSFEQTADLQLLRILSPNIKTVHYTGISVLSALKTAITDRVNKPDVLLLQNGNSRFDYTDTENEELIDQLKLAAAEGISVISPFTFEHDNNFLLGSTDNILNNLDYTLKCFAGSHMNTVKDMFPIKYKSEKFASPMTQLNPVIWALRIAYLNDKLGYKLGYFQNFLEIQACKKQTGTILLNVQNKYVVGYNSILLNSETMLINDMLSCFENKGGDNEW